MTRNINKLCTYHQRYERKKHSCKEHYYTHDHENEATPTLVNLHVFLLRPYKTDDFFPKISFLQIICMQVQTHLSQTLHI